MALRQTVVRSSQKPNQQIELNKSKLSLKEFRIREIIMATQFYDELPLFGTLRFHAHYLPLEGKNSTTNKQQNKSLLVLKRNSPSLSCAL
jgi:hypothetical protein